MNPPVELLKLLEPCDDFDSRLVVEALIHQAIQVGASDLHLRPTPDGVQVLARSKGILQCLFNLPCEGYGRLLSGLKNMAGLASYRKSVPQNGRMMAGQTEIRVATTPTHFGEKVVLRVARFEGQNLELEQLGFSSEELDRLKRVVDQPQGLVLATGPAGSGKSTTLFAVMHWLFRAYRDRIGPTPRASLNVVSLEDPIETVHPEFTQIQIQPALGMTYATALRSILRQDPEVILLGEIRDRETASAAVQASLTGHLVLSTLHARDSIGVIPRLLEMGVEPYLLSASLAGVLYQRLIRHLCVQCRAPADVPPDKPARWGLRAGSLCKPVGCEVCNLTGFDGRTGIIEILEIDETIRQGILDRRSLSELRSCAAESGMIPLWQAALRRVSSGITSWEEVCRTIPVMV